MRSADPVGESSDDQVDPQMPLDRNLTLGATMVRNASEQHRCRSNRAENSDERERAATRRSSMRSRREPLRGKASRENGEKYSPTFRGSHRARERIGHRCDEPCHQRRYKPRHQQECE